MVNSEFRQIKKYYSKDYSADLIEYVHEKTGLRLVRAYTEDEEYFFSLNFNTIPSDSSGVQHILEHTVLNGSLKYPFKDPFSYAVQGSSCSYINAFTAEDFTSFPAAGMVLHDLEKIFQMYCDAVFHPLLEKGAFLQEGIRYELDGRGMIKDFNGVVYNEVSDDLSTRFNALFKAYRKIFFKDTYFRFASGGDVDEIPFLTYERFLEYYKKNYTFDNCILVLYGKEDCDSFADYIVSEYLSEKRSSCRKRKSRRIPELKLENKMHRGFFDRKDSALPSFYRFYALDIDYGDMVYYRSFSVLAHALLGNEKSILRKKLLATGLFKDISDESGFADECGRLVFTIGLDDVTAADAEGECSAAIDRILQEIEAEGIAYNAIRNAIHLMKFEKIERVSATPQGIDITLKVMKGLQYGDAFRFFGLSESFDILEEIFKKDPDFFNRLFKKLFMNNGKCCSLVLKPSDSIIAKLEKRKKAIIEKLNSVHTSAKLKKDRLVFRQFSGKVEKTDLADMFSFADARELYAYFKSHEVEALDMKSGGYSRAERNVLDERKYPIVLYKHSELTCLKNARLLFDVSDYTDAELKNLEILNEVIRQSELKTGDVFFDEFYCYVHDFDLSTKVVMDFDCKVRIYLYVTFRSLEEDYGTALSLVGKYLREFEFDEKKLSSALKVIQSDFESDPVSFAPSCANYLASSMISSSVWYDNMVNGLEFYGNVRKILSEQVDISDDLRRLSARTFVKERMIFYSYCKEPDTALVLDFVNSFQSGSIGKIRNLSETSRIRDEISIYPIPGTLSYSQMAFRADSGNPVYSAILSHLGNTSLYQLVRVKGGSYGTYASYSIEDGLCRIASYRDPRLDETFDDFLKALEYEFDEKNLKIAVDAYFSPFVRPSTNAGKAYTELMYFLINNTDEQRRRWCEEVLALTVDKANDAMAHLRQYAVHNHKASATGLSGKKANV